MGGTLTDPQADLAAARDRFALAAIANGASRSEHLGRLILRPHQRTAIGRLLGIIGRYRGALLADAVGLGKTYVALAIAREFNRPLLICPAGLRTMWDRAMNLAGAKFPVIGIESLARGDRIGFEPDLVVIDEAHHLRTPTTRRYEAVASLAHRGRVLLLSATPLHNKRRDLTSVLALFLGSAVHAWTDDELSRVIVRRDENTADQHLPALVGPVPLCPGADDDCLDAICALPLAVPASDEGTAAALSVISLVHLWASSRAALVTSLRSRRARAVALTHALASGHLPSAAELAAWHYADDALQLAFPFCVTGRRVELDRDEIGERLDAYIAAVTRLLYQLRGSIDPDEARAGLLRTLREAHPDARIVAFSQYAQTIVALGRLLRADARIAVVTSSSARIASGAVTRQEILDQFAGGARPTSASERVDLLLSTDLLSEGVDLRGASIVVNLDLPWNPARIEQRIGRARRIGSPHPSIHVYTFVPPTAAERMLDLQKRLSTKIGIAARIVGGSAVIPVADIDNGEVSPVIAAEKLLVRLASWTDPVHRRDPSDPVVAAATANTRGWLCVLVVNGGARFLCWSEGNLNEDPTRFLHLVEQLGDAATVDRGFAAAASEQIDSWISARRLRDDIGVETAYPVAKRAVLDRLTQTVSRAPRHRKPALVAAAQRARSGVASAYGIGAERILRELVRSPADDEAWIHSVEAFATVQAATGDTPIDTPTIAALILLQSQPRTAPMVRAIV
jgi:superfamily II DNA or RNA helicase